MIKTNLLWSSTINPTNDRIVKEPTVLGATLLGILFIAGLAAIVFLAF